MRRNVVLDRFEAYSNRLREGCSVAAIQSAVVVLFIKLGNCVSLVCCPPSSIFSQTYHRTPFIRRAHWSTDELKRV